MKKATIPLALGIITICIGVLIFALNDKARMTQAEHEQAFKNLLNYWQLSASTEYKVVQYKRRNVHFGSGPEIYLFQVIIPTSAVRSNSWFVEMSSQDYAGKEVWFDEENPKSFPVYLNPQSNNKMRWYIRPEFPRLTRQPDWWKPETKHVNLYGYVVTKDTSKYQYIHFYIVERTNSMSMFVESLSRKGLQLPLP